MSRHRTPSNVLDARGAFLKNPGRREARAGEPKALEPLGDAPERLSEKQAEAWREIVDNAHAGVLCKADRHAVEMASILLAALWEKGIEMSGAHLSRLETLLAKFGMNPSDRSRVTAPQPEPEDPAGKYFR